MPKLNQNDLVLMRDAAIQHYVTLPAISRFPGMNRDFSESERRTLSYLEAGVEVMSRLGLLKDGVDKNLPRVLQYTFLHEVLDEETEGVVPRDPV